MIDPRGSARRIRVWRYAPSAQFQPFVDHHWIIEWDVTGTEPEWQRVIPSPNAHLVISPRETALFGVVRGLEERRLHGRGRAHGMRFRVGGLRPFISHPMAVLTGRRAPAATLTGCDDRSLEACVLAQDSHDCMIHAAEAFLEPRLPNPDGAVELVCSIIAAIRREGGVRQASALAKEFGMSLRALQRLFSDYVGVSPKWVIRRYRLQDAAYLLATDHEVQLAALAAELGYFDQAHLAQEFRRLYGVSPAQYRQSQIGF
jgi:AraC-like DNA-binding protein